MINNESLGILSKADAKTELKPLVPVLLESFWEAWEWTKQWVDGDEKARMIIDSSALAAIVSNAFGYYARPRLVDQFKAQWIARGRFQQATIGQKLSLRFKKMTPDLRTMNVRTEQQRRVYQQEDAVLPGAQRITSLTFGYTLNVVRYEITGVYFSCPIDFDQNAWDWQVYPEEGRGQLTMFEDTPTEAKIADVLKVAIKLKRRKAGNE